MQNELSPTWYSTFLDSIAPEVTQAEIAFLERQLPRSSFPSILDLCCGPGRHALPLARRGYRVLGIDQNSQAIEKARDASVGFDATFMVGDMRQLAALHRSVDGVINLWQSFGYFDASTNGAIVKHIASTLRPGGRAIFDLYNRLHMERLPTDDAGERAGVRFHTTRQWNGPRLTVTVEYESGARDTSAWLLYSPQEFAAVCAQAGLDVIVQCAWFSESISPSADHARMQLVVERAGE
jgi:SAM-dependent methyltransferase